MRLLFTIFSFYFAVAAWAQQPLTLEQVREMALEHNHKAKDAKLTTRIAEQAVRQYRANYFPDFSLMGMGIYGSSRRTMFELPTSQLSGILAGMTGMSLQVPDIKLDWELDFVWHGGVQMTQPLYMGGKIMAANKIAKHSLAMAKQNERLTDTEVIEQADAAFFNVVKATELLVVAKRYRELLVELEKNVQSAVDVGLKMPADLLRVQVKKNEVELQVRRAENGVRLSKMNLNYVIGRGLGDAIEVKYVAEGISETVTANGERPEAVILAEKAEIARQQVKVARAELLPSVALLASYGYTNGLKVNDTKLFDGADFIGGVTVSVPIYHFGERQAKLRQAKLRQQQAENERDNVNEQLRLALAKAQNDIDEAELEAELGDLSVEQAQKSLDMTRQQYDAGMATLSDMLDAQAQWQKAHQQRIESKCNLQVARTALQKALGTLR